MRYGGCFSQYTDGVIQERFTLSDSNALAGRTVAVVNLPHAEKLVRRYMCTYRSPFFYFPPHELLQVAACIKEGTGAHVVFLDAIAENQREEDVVRFLQKHQPEFLITLLGVESVASDLQCAMALRQSVPGMRVAVFGYYATQFPLDIMEDSEVDALFRGDAEASCVPYLIAAVQGNALKTIPGLVGRDKTGRFLNEPAYIRDYDTLPLPDYTMVNLRRYKEMLLGGPFATVQTARGCPYACTYCTSPQDSRYVTRSPKRIVEEIEGLARLNVKVFRFLDDTFTASKERVITVCQEILRRKIVMKWSCLSRVDTLDAEMLSWMEEAGCVRVIVGVESYAPGILGVFGKRIAPETINSRLRLIREAGMESLGFIVVGGPFESEADFELTRRGLLSSPLDLVIVHTISIYGGSAMAQRFKSEIEFQLMPYISRWNNPDIDRIALQREKTLYRQFYFRPRILLRQMYTIFRYPARSFRLFLLLISFLSSSSQNRERKDLF